MYYTTSSLNGKEIYHRLAKEHNWKPCLEILSSNGFETITTESLMKTTTPKYCPVIRPKTFLCFNRIERPHRINLIGKLIKENLINTGYCSMYGQHYDATWIDQQLKQNNLECIEPEVSNIIIKNKHLFPMHLTGDKHARNNPIQIINEDSYLFNNSYYSLVTETLFYKNDVSNPMCYSIFFSEKTFKPIIMKHPFILVAPAYSLRWLKKIGYKTFSPYIDESYDNEDNDAIRLNMIVCEVQRLNNFTDDQWLDWQQKVAEIVDFNYNILMNKTRYNVRK